MSNVKYTFSDDGTTGCGWLLDGTRFVFDAEDFDKIRDINWCRNLNCKDSRRLYIINCEGTYLHRFIISEVPSGYEVDHISLDTLDMNKRYDSISSIARALNVCPENIVSCLNGRRKPCGGYQRKYA